MNRMNNPAFWDTMVNDKISDGVANRPFGSALTNWKSADEIEPVKVGVKFRIFLILAGIICFVVAAATLISVGNIGWAEVGGNLKNYAEDVGSLVVFPILGVVCFWLALKKRQK